jgi:hypothetical protein
MKWKWNWLRNHAKVPYKVLLWLERKASHESWVNAGMPGKTASVRAYAQNRSKQ